MARGSGLRAIELMGDVDDRRQLHAEMPEGVRPGQVRLIVLLPEEDDAGQRWAEAVATEWSDELADSRQDLYTINDGQPVDAPR